jgi:adenosyl cobinamide kinase/adenosyl cobinamide phosphate guanylyltransferase
MQSDNVRRGWKAIIVLETFLNGIQRINSCLKSHEMVLVTLVDLWVQHIGGACGRKMGLSATIQARVHTNVHQSTQHCAFKTHHVIFFGNSLN